MLRQALVVILVVAVTVQISVPTQVRQNLILRRTRWPELTGGLALLDRLTVYIDVCKIIIKCIMWNNDFFKRIIGTLLRKCGIE